MSVILGLTGGIATGKSTVAKLFEKRGAYLSDTDSVAKHVLKDDAALKEIHAAFGDGAFTDNVLDRHKLAQIIFSSPEKRNTLNMIVHPKVRKRVNNCLKTIETNDTNLIVIEVPLLFEAGFEDLCDKTLVVHTNNTIQLERLTKRDAIDASYAQKKINAQMPMEDKMKRADYLVDNSHSIAETLDQVDTVIKKAGE